MNKQNKELITRYCPPYATIHRRLPTQGGGRRTKRAAILSLAVLLCLGITMKILSGNEKTNNAAASKAPATQHTQHAQPAPLVKPTTTSDQMAAAITQTIAANTDVDIAVSILDLKTGTLSHFGVPGTVVFEAASVAKLITASDYLRHVETGDLTLAQDINGSTAQDNLEQMIVNSDNDAWVSLNNTLTHPDLSAYATAIGMASYDPDANTVAPDDIAHLEQKLYQGKLLNKSNTQLLLGYMAQANRTDLIKAAIPAGTAFYHKAGWLEDREHDAAIIDNGTHPYILVIFTNGQDNAHPNDRATVIQDITRATVSHFIAIQ